MNILLFIYIYDVDISSRKLSWELPSWELSNQKLSHDKILGLWRSFLVQILKVFAGCQMKKDEPGIQHFIVFRHIRCVFHLMPTSNANSVSGAWRYSYFKLEKLQTFGHDKYLVGKHVIKFPSFWKNHGRFGATHVVCMSIFEKPHTPPLQGMLAASFFCGQVVVLYFPIQNTGCFLKLKKPPCLTKRCFGKRGIRGGTIKFSWVFGQGVVL